MRRLSLKRLSSFTSYRSLFNFAKKPPPSKPPRTLKDGTQFNFARKPRPSTPPRTLKDESRTTMTYLFALAFATAGAAYAAVPLYRVFCQQTGYGGTTQVCVYPPR